MQDPQAQRLKDALLGLLPEHWRMWLVVAAIGFLVVTNPQAAWFFAGKLKDGVAAIVDKIRTFNFGGATMTAPAAATTKVADFGIDAPLAAAQEQISWAVRTGNSDVFDAGVAMLKALQVAKALAPMLLLLCVVGCSSSEAPKAAQNDCEYSQSHQFGLAYPPQGERDRVYSTEPTLFQLEPGLAK